MQTAKFELDGHSLITPASISAALTGDNSVSSDGAVVDALKGEASAVLDGMNEEFRTGKSAYDVFPRVVAYLHDLRSRAGTAHWPALIPAIQQHPIAEFIHQDPLTKRSWDKPRGYSGDAHLLDLLYQHPAISDEIAAATRIGREIYDCTKNSPAALANTDRRNILARFADEAADRTGANTEIMSIAAGHVREVDYSVAARDGRIKRWVALDQDPESVATVASQYAGTCVETVNGSVRDILMNRIEPGLFDHVYSSGLYDYLNEKVAVTLTRRTLDFVRPGGTFLFANYSRPIPDDGFMETFMNWSLILRDRHDMEEIIRQATEGMEVETEVFHGENRNVIFAVIRKK